MRIFKLFQPFLYGGLSLPQSHLRRKLLDQITIEFFREMRAVFEVVRGLQVAVAVNVMPALLRAECFEALIVLRHEFKGFNLALPFLGDLDQVADVNIRIRIDRLVGVDVCLVIL